MSFDRVAIPSVCGRLNLIKELWQTRIQVCRGYATVQYYKRHLQAELGQKDVTGSDTRTFIISIISSPEIIEMHVH